MVTIGRPIVAYLIAIVTFLSLVSRQIWPQVLGILHGGLPSHLVLLHTDETAESAGPARRLRDLLFEEKLMGREAVELVRLPHDHFDGITEGLANVGERLQLDSTNSILHFTGGNKLMALAATRWCSLNETPCFYLERDFRVFPFRPQGGELLPQPPFQIDQHLAREIEPLRLLRCQLGEAEITGPGQRLTLNERGKRLPETEIGPLLRKDEDFRKFLDWDIDEPASEAGFALEYAAAVALLRLGVPVVQRSVKLASRPFANTGRAEGELDLVFNWAGKLWVVDCKDRRSAQTRVDELRAEILQQIHLPPRISSLLNRLEDELRARELHPLKEDLLAISESGGILGRAVCVRRSQLPIQAVEFAHSRKLPIVLKDNLVVGLRALLFPTGSP